MKHYVALKVLRNQHSELVCFLNLEGFSCGTRRIDECMIIDIVLLVLTASLNFSFELKLPTRGVGHSPLTSTPSAGDPRQSRFQASLDALGRDCPQGAAGCLASPELCWPCTGCGEFVTWVEVKSLCPQGQVQDSSSW